MSHIFAIRKDIPKYQILDLDLLDITRNLPNDVDLDAVYDFSLQNTSMTQWWNAPETKYVNVEKSKAQAPDISCWVDATLVLSPKAYRLLKDSIATIGEFLPVTIGSETHYIFNCLQLAEANEEKTMFNDADGYRAGLEHLEFRDETKDKLLFKSKTENCLTLFCNERFKDIVEAFELRGIMFDKDLIVA